MQVCLLTHLYRTRALGLTFTFPPQKLNCIGGNIWKASEPVQIKIADKKIASQGRDFVTVCSQSRSSDKTLRQINDLKSVSNWGVERTDSRQSVQQLRAN